MSGNDKYEEIALDVIRYLIEKEIDIKEIDKNEVVSYIRENSTIH